MNDDEEIKQSKSATGRSHFLSFNVNSKNVQTYRIGTPV